MTTVTKERKAITQETRVLMMERKAIEALDSVAYETLKTDLPALPSEYARFFAFDSRKDSDLLEAARNDDRLSAREKTKIGLLAVIAHLKGSEMRVAGDSDIAAAALTRAHATSYKEVCDATKAVGCIMQRYTANINVAVAEEFEGLEASLTCTELSQITDLNDQWYSAAADYGDDSYDAMSAKLRLQRYIANLPIV